MKKNCRNPGWRRSTRKNHGAASSEEDGRRGGSDEGEQPAQAARRQAPQQEDRARQRERDEPLREEGARGRRAGRRGEPEPGAARLPAPDRRAAREQRGREEEGEQSVGQVRAGHEEPDRAREQQDAGREALAPPAARGQHEQERRAEPRESGRKTGRPRRLSEDPEGGRVGPVQQGRLLEVRQAVQTRHDEVPRREHLAGDLGVARLVGLGQARAGGLDQDDGREQQEGCVEDPLAPRSVCRSLHGRFRSLPSAVLRFPPL